MNDFTIKLLIDVLEIFIFNLSWFILYLLYKYIFPWKIIIISSLMIFVYFLLYYDFKRWDYIILYTLIAGNGAAGFFLYLKELHRSFKYRKINLPILIPLIFYISCCCVMIGIRQN